MPMANQNINLLISIIMDDPTINYCRSVEDIHIPMITRFDRLILVFKDLSDLNNTSFVRVIQRIIMISQETWSAGSVTSLGHNQSSKTMKYKHITIKWMIVINTSCRVRDTSAIHKPAIRNASTGRRVRWLRVSHWRQEQTQADHVVLFGLVMHSSHWYAASSLSCTTRKRRGPSSFHGVSHTIARECENVSLRWIAIGEHIEGREGRSFNNRVSLLSQETGERQSETSRTCDRWIHHREGRGTPLRSWAVHLHMLYQVQSTTLVQQEELSITRLLPQWLVLRFHIHHEAHRDNAWGPRSHSNHWR